MLSALLRSRYSLVLLALVLIFSTAAYSGQRRFFHFLKGAPVMTCDSEASAKAMASALTDNDTQAALQNHGCLVMEDQIANSAVVSDISHETYGDFGLLEVCVYLPERHLVTERWILHVILDFDHRAHAPSAHFSDAMRMAFPECFPLTNTD